MYTYSVERVDTLNFHGWVIYEQDEAFEWEYFSSENLDEIREVMSDLGAL